MEDVADVQIRAILHDAMRSLPERFHSGDELQLLGSELGWVHDRRSDLATHSAVLHYPAPASAQQRKPVE